MLIMRSECNNFGGGVALLIGNHLHPKKLTIHSTCEMAAATIDHSFELIILSVYHSPTTPVADFTAQMWKTISQFKTASMCIIGDFNEGCVQNGKHLLLLTTATAWPETNSYKTNTGTVEPSLTHI